jgi:hypothetical protein
MTSEYDTVEIVDLRMPERPKAAQRPAFQPLAEECLDERESAKRVSL